MSPVQLPDRNEPRVIDPTELPVTERRAAFLARESGLNQSELTGKSVAEANRLIRWRVDPQFLLMRRICGQVVKRDPITGELCPVPGATVTIEDTDCTLLGFFPVESPYSWLLPINCEREDLATVTTDACGRFCVNLPWWDVDRLLRFRKRRFCLPEIYRPRLRDIIDPLPDPPDLRDPGPAPDPLPIERITPALVEEVRLRFGEAVAGPLNAAVLDATFSRRSPDLGELLDVPLPPSPPPLPRSFHEDPEEAVREIAGATGLEPHVIGHMEPERFTGPFTRCVDVWTAEWVSFYDVPDITFRVTQDVDVDGVEEQIYGESFFDVRWNAPSGLNVLLEAGPAAICVPFCDGGDGIPCEDEPAISSAGTMPLESAYHNNASGYATRVNRPSSSGSYAAFPPDGSGPANAVTPYARTLNLLGCHRIGDASHYRLTYSRDGAPAVPFTGISWWAPALAGPPVHIVPNGEGWYPILPPGNLAHPNWLLHWNTNTAAFSQGTYAVRLELGTSGPGGISLVNSSDPPVTFIVDNKKPELTYHQVSWRYDEPSTWQALPAECPVITREPRDVLVRVTWSAAAPHMRNAGITFEGCGGAVDPLLVDPSGSPSIDAYRYWYQSHPLTSISRTNQFRIPAAAVPGCYTLRLAAHSRGFEPRGTKGPALNWLMVQGDLYSTLPRSISLVNA